MSILLVGLLGFYFLTSLFYWYVDVNSYGVIGMEDDQPAIRYGLGAPGKIENGGKTWVYHIEAGAVLRAEFSADQTLDRVSCTSSTAEPNSCPQLYGVGVGETEDVIGHHLGNPSYVRIDGDRKYVTYEGLGATYVLQQFVVTGLIRDPHQGSFFGKTFKFFRSMFYLPGWLG